MDTRTYEVLPTGNLAFSDNASLKNLSFEKKSITSKYSRKEKAFFICANLKNDRAKQVIFRIPMRGFTSCMQFDWIKRQVRDRAS